MAERYGTGYDYERRMGRDEGRGREDERRMGGREQEMGRFDRDIDYGRGGRFDRDIDYGRGMGREHEQRGFGEQGMGRGYEQGGWGQQRGYGEQGFGQQRGYEQGGWGQQRGYGGEQGGWGQRGYGEQGFGQGGRRSMYEGGGMMGRGYEGQEPRFYGPERSYGQEGRMYEQGGFGEQRGMGRGYGEQGGWEQQGRFQGGMGGMGGWEREGRFQGTMGGIGGMGGGWEQQQQQRFGMRRGPKGYKRSDDRIREDLCDRLSDHPIIDSSDVEVKVQNGEVILSGNVKERRHKHMIEQVAESISGVQDVRNEIRVKREEMMETRGAGGNESMQASGATRTQGAQGRTAS